MGIWEALEGEREREKCGDYLINLKIKNTDSTANYLGSVLSNKIL